MLTVLIDVLTIDVLSNWCDLETVAKVDSAFCNKTDRLNVLSLLADHTFGSTDCSNDGRAKSFWRWIGQRAIKVRCMTVAWNDDIWDRLVANVDCSKVTEIFVLHLNQVDLVAQLINQSLNLKTLQISSFHIWTDLNRLTSLIADRICSGLKNLSLGKSHHINSTQLNNVAAVCRQLRVLSVINIHEDVLVQIIRKNKHLQDLVMTRCTCTTVLMKVIEKNCGELQSLTIGDIKIESFNENCCSSIESVWAIISSKRHLTCFSFGEGVYFTMSESASRISITKQQFVPIFPTVLTQQYSHLKEISLSHKVDESVLFDISFKCPLLTSLCIFEGNYSASSLRSVVARCTKLRCLSLRFVSATYDEMMSIFCSEQILVLSTIIVLTTVAHPQLTIQIRKSNSSVKHCKTTADCKL